jgi:hypothetical protein
MVPAISLSNSVRDDHITSATVLPFNYRLLDESDYLHLACALIAVRVALSKEACFDRTKSPKTAQYH